MHHTDYSFIERIALYLALDGTITLTMGNQRLSVSSDQAERIIESRLRSHAVFVQVVRGYEPLHNGNRNEAVTEELVQ